MEGKYLRMRHGGGALPPLLANSMRMLVQHFNSNFARIEIEERTYITEKLHQRLMLRCISFIRLNNGLLYDISTPEGLLFSWCNLDRFGGDHAVLELFLRSTNTKWQIYEGRTRYTAHLSFQGQ